jgi:U3 small nucleolar RNA-associated protein 10
MQETAVAILCKKNSSRRKSGEKKRQKLSVDEASSLPPSTFDHISLQSLQSLLLCLERSLRSDARDGGGSWIRSETQRFDLLLEPLMKLFQVRLEPFDPQSQSLSYRSLVRGHEDQRSRALAGADGGTVIDTVVALALATGDEQMWKPLNHAVLRACSDEGRAEVRNSGAACLLALINAIGEEYMVLIPECLPVLSELLEDADEDTAGLAQECISQSEELLGESINF